MPFCQRRKERKPMSTQPYEILGLNDFKTNLCKYMQALHTGEVESYFIRRYQRHVALVFSTRHLRQQRDNDKAVLRVKKKEDAIARHAEQRRVISARLLSSSSARMLKLLSQT